MFSPSLHHLSPKVSPVINPKLGKEVRKIMSGGSWQDHLTTIKTEPDDSKRKNMARSYVSGALFLPGIYDQDLTTSNTVLTNFYKKNNPTSLFSKANVTKAVNSLLTQSTIISYLFPEILENNPGYKDYAIKTLTNNAAFANEISKNLINLFPKVQNLKKQANVFELFRVLSNTFFKIKESITNSIKNIGTKRPSYLKNGIVQSEKFEMDLLQHLGVYKFYDDLVKALTKKSTKTNKRPNLGWFYDFAANLDHPFVQFASGHIPLNRENFEKFYDVLVPWKDKSGWQRYANPYEEFHMWSRDKLENLFDGKVRILFSNDRIAITGENLSITSNVIDDIIKSYSLGTDDDSQTGSLIQKSTDENMVTYSWEANYPRVLDFVHDVIVGNFSILNDGVINYTPSARTDVKKVFDDEIQLALTPDGDFPLSPTRSKNFLDDVSTRSRNFLDDPSTSSRPSLRRVDRLSQSPLKSHRTPKTIPSKTFEMGSISGAIAPLSIARKKTEVTLGLDLTEMNGDTPIEQEIRKFFTSPRGSQTN